MNVRHHTTPLRPVRAIVAAIALTVTAAGCADAGPPSADDVASAAEVFDLEVLAVGDGNPTTLREAVTGDRPVLLWFYAPH